MRALVLEDWWKLVVAARPDPTASEGRVLLQVHATGICGSDIHGFTGETGRRRPGQVMGHETVGRIAAIGPGVPDELGLKAGDVATVNPVMANAISTSTKVMPARLRGGNDVALRCKMLVFKGLKTPFAGISSYWTLTPHFHPKTYHFHPVRQGQ